MATLRKGQGIPIVTKAHRLGEIVKLHRVQWDDGRCERIFEVRLASNQFVLLHRDDFDFADFVISFKAIQRIRKVSLER